MTRPTPQALLDAAAVEPVAPETYRVDLVEDYTVFGYPNGGYLQCVMANAALAAASDDGGPHLHATAVTTNFIAPPSVGPATLHTTVRRIGRGVSFVHVTLSQGEGVLTEALVTLGNLSDHSEVRYQVSTPFDLPPVEECVELPLGEGMSIHNAVELRGDPADAKWWDGDVADKGELRLWMRLTDGGAVWNGWNVLFATDALPPATLPLGSSGWVPTLQLTSYVRRLPTSEWLRARQWCVTIADGTVDERCELYDDRGELVASSSQLAMVRFSAEH